MTDKTPREEWFDFLENYMREGHPEDHLAYDNKEFLQKIKLYFNNRSVVCDGKIDLSYVYFRIKEVIDDFIDKDFRREIGHIRSDVAVLKDKTNKEIFDVKKQVDKVNDSLTKKIETLGASTRADISHLKKTLEDEIENVVAQFTDDINGVKDYFNDLCAGIEETHKNDIDALKSQMETFANLTSQAVENAIAKAKEELEAEIEEVKNEIQSGIDGTYDELKEKIEKNAEDISAINDSLGQPNGIATLDEDGKIPTDQLPEWTDDVIEVFAEYSIDENGDLINIELFTDYRKTNEITEGEIGKLYVDVTSDDLTYIFRWTGREWVCVNNFASHNDIASIQNEISNIQGDITGIQGDVKDLFDTCATKDELNSAVEGLEKEISNITGEAGSEGERISALEESVETLEDNVKTNAEAIEDLQESKQDKLTAGEGIDITDNVISSTVDTALYEVVANLPTSDIDINKIYVVPVREKSHNKCTEYIYVDGKWEVLGNKTNLDDYYTVEQIDALLEVIDKNVEANTENIAANTSSIEKNTTNIENNTTKIDQIESKLAELGVEIGDDESKLSTIEKQVETNTNAIETKQDKLTAGTGIAINEINGETVIECTLDTSLYIFCTVLPTTDIDPNKIYVTPSNTPGEDNVYIEWLYVDGAWEKIGELHGDLDMSDYYTKSEVDAKINTLETSIESVGNDLANTKSELESSIESTKTDLQAAIDSNASNIETNAAAISELDESKQNKLVAGTNISLTDNVDGTTTVSCEIDTACYKIVASLPEKPDDADVDKIFMVPSNDQESQNEFVEYIWVDTTWEQVGTNSYTKEQVDAIKDALQASIDTLTSTVESDNTSVTESIEKLKSSIEDVESSLESTKSDLQSQIDTNTSAIEANTSAIATNASAIETNTSVITELSENKQDKLTAGAGITINEINGETVIECTCESTITSLQEQVNNIDSDLKTAEDAIATNTSAIETLHGDVTSNASAIEELQSDVETKQDKLTAGTGIEINEINGETVITWTEEQRLSDAESNITSNTNAISELNENKQDKLTAGYGIEITTDNTINVTLDTSIYKIVTVLPTQPDEEDENKIFVVPSPTQGDDNLYIEYLWVIDAWEKIGELHTEVDLSDYYTKSEIDSTVGELKDAIETNTSAIETNISAIESNTSSISALEIKHQSDIDSLNALVSDLTGVEHTDFENVQSLISGLQESVTTNTANIETLQSDVISNTSAIETNASAIEANTTAISDLQDSKQDKLTAGTGISITEVEGENIIACTIDHTLYKIVPSLPSQPDDEDKNKIFLVPSNSSEESNEFVEYIWVESSTTEGQWEKIGEFKADTDLSSYATIDYVDAKVTDLQSQIDTNTASIEANTSNIATNTAAIETNASNISTNASAIEDLKTQISNLEGAETSDIEALKEQVETNAANIATNTAAIETNASNIATNTNAIEELKEQVNEIDDDLSTAESNIASNKEAIDSLQDSKQDKLTAGTGISIEDNVIACTLDTTVFKIVESLPTSDIDTNIIYVVPAETTGENNSYIEYIYVNGSWEKLGEFQASTDLSNYYTKEEVNALTDALDTRIEELKEQVNEVEEAEKADASNISSLENSVSTIESSVESLEERTTTNESNISALQVVVSSVTDWEESEITTVNELVSDVADLKTAVETNTSNIETNANAIDELKNQVDSINDDLKTEIATNTAAIESLEDRVSANETAIEELQSDVEAKQDKLTAGTGIAINEINGETVIEWTEEQRLGEAESNIASNASAIEELSESKQDKLTAGTGISINKINDETVIACTLDTDVFVVEGALPENPSEENVNKIYVVPGNETEEGNRFVEYIWIGSSYVEGAWEKLGEFSADVDLSAYATTAEVKEQVDELDSKIESNTAAIETNTSAIEELQSQLDSASEEIGDVEATLQETIDGVESSLNNSVDELKERLSDDEATIASNTASIESNASAIENLESTKQDTLSAGTGISIENNVIACTLDTKFCVFVDKLPETGEENKLYLVKKTGTVQSDNLFDEWIWGDETGWEYIGGINPEVDLADYYTKTQVDDMINELKNSLLNDLKPYLENISSSIETLQGDVTNIKETVEDTSDDIKIITQILAGMTGTSI